MTARKGVFSMPAPAMERRVWDPRGCTDAESRAREALSILKFKKEHGALKEELGDDSAELFMEMQSRLWRILLRDPGDMLSRPRLPMPFERVQMSFSDGTGFVGRDANPTDVTIAISSVPGVLTVDASRVERCARKLAEKYGLSVEVVRAGVWRLTW